MNKIIKRTGKYILSIFLILILLGLSVLILSSIYKEELEDFVLKELNKELNVKVHIESLDISPFRKFPYISVVLTDATALSSSFFKKEMFNETDTDTLFTASKIYLQFNIIDVIHNNYRLRRAHISGGHIKLLADLDGKVNYNLFKKQNKTMRNSVSFDLDGIKISDIKWTYINLSKNIRTTGDLKDILLKGNLSNSDYKLSIEGSCSIDSISRDDILFTYKLDAGIKVNMEVNDSLFNINKGELNLNDMDFIVAGTFTLGEQTNLELQLRANSIDIKSFLTSLPFKINFVEKYNPKGTIDFLARISGKMSQTLLPDLRVAFNLVNVKTHLREKNILIEGLNAKGTYSNGTIHNALSSSIKISEYVFRTGKTNLRGNFLIENFTHPYIKADITGNIDARQLQGFITTPGLTVEKGFLHPEITLNASLKDLKQFNKSKINTAGINGNIVLDSISCDIPGIHEHVDYLDGIIKVSGDNWYPEVIAKSKESDIRIKIEADHVLGRFLFNKTSLWLRGDLYSHYLDLKKFIVKETGNDTSMFFLPEKLNATFDYSIDSLICGKFGAKNINSVINYKENILSISSLVATTLKGRIAANGMLTQKLNGDMIIKSQSNLNNLDINHMFYTFNNFTQKFIVADNLKGSISGNVDMSLTTENNFHPKYNTLIVDSDVTISNGELIEFEPIMQLSRYISLSELEHIKFSSLHNSIIIQDSKVNIPKMDINSSAFNITASGTHGFDNYFEYKVKVNLSEILANKVYKAKKENEEFGIIEKDDSEKTSIYLAINGTPDDYKVKYDKKEAIVNIRNDLQNEKKTLKSILKQEFSFNKKDTIVPGSSDKKTSDKFILDWGNDDDNTDKNDKQEPDKVKKPEFEIEW